MPFVMQKNAEFQNTHGTLIVLADGSKRSVRHNIYIYCLVIILMLILCQRKRENKEQPPLPTCTVCDRNEKIKI